MTRALLVAACFAALLPGQETGNTPQTDLVDAVKKAEIKQ